MHRSCSRLDNFQFNCCSIHQLHILLFSSQSTSELQNCSIRCIQPAKKNHSILAAAVMQFTAKTSSLPALDADTLEWNDVKNGTRCASSITDSTSAPTDEKSLAIFYTRHSFHSITKQLH